ncbi:MAG: hypothetical protein B7733_03225 [Myxococcales bacterium FL481]|nr:MAG: hypothetical protein B7733_03225 [Myxococcales bacterium FL481]
MLEARPLAPVVSASAACFLSACIGAGLPGATPASAYQHRDPIDLSRLRTTREQAERRPSDARAQFVAGMAHVRAALRGYVQARDPAEFYLERAFRLDADAFPSARVLGRFTNMRSSVFDTSKVPLQVELYRSMASTDGRHPQDLMMPAFHVHGFLAADLALHDLAQGRAVSAWRRVRRLERELEARTQAYPDEIDTFSMAGTFASTFAAALPLGKRKRARQAAEYFEVQQSHWDELSPPARNTGWAPNTRVVFALTQAELWLASGEVTQARRAYDRVLTVAAPSTRIRAQLRRVARHRQTHLQRYAGKTQLLPPWPHGTISCVACHAEETTLPTDTLYVEAELDP